MGKRARVFLAVMMISMAFGTYSVEATSKDVGGTVHIQSESGTEDEDGDVTVLGKSFDDKESDETTDKGTEESTTDKEEGTTKAESEDDTDKADAKKDDSEKHESKNSSYTAENEESFDLDESKSYIYGIADNEKFASKPVQLYNSNGKEAIKVKLPIGCENLAFVSSDYGVFSGKDEDHPVCVSASAIYGKVEGTDALEKLDTDSLLYDVVVVQSKNYDNLQFYDKFESYEETFATQDFKENLKKKGGKKIEVVSGVYNGLEYKSMMCTLRDGETYFSKNMYVKMTNTQWLELSSANINEKSAMDKKTVERIWSTVLDYIEL